MKTQLTFTESSRVLGLLPSENLCGETVRLEQGDTFVLFTDGVSEAFDRDGNLFGEERVLAILDGLTDETARLVTETLLDRVRCHAAGAKQSDDITIVTVRYRNPAT